MGRDRSPAKGTLAVIATFTSHGGSAGRYPSPLRYPGGKGKLANYLKLILLENDLVGRSYLEAYAGGASVALSLLFGEFVSDIHINDINRGVYAFWRSAIEEPDALCRLIADAKLSITNWDRQRAVQKDPNASLLELGFSTFFLNRTNRSGIVNGGIIGGRSQLSTWRIDARFNRKELIRRIQKISRFNSRITVTRLDAAKLLQDIARALPSTLGLVYLDPPYFSKGRDLYEDWYSLRDHAAIEELARSLRCPVVVSYDTAPEVMSLYSSWTHVKYDLSYSAAERYSGREVMFFGRGIQHPSVRSPAKISTEFVHRAQVGRLISA